MKNTYQERQEEKRERYLARADRAEREADSQRKRSNAISDMIPMGQPILVGHHSEKRHRRDLERMDNSMRKSFEEREKAEHYRRKVENIENPRAISSDDPEAVSKLTVKLAKMESYREALKAKNKELRAAGEESLPSYVLSNLGGNIRRVKQRIKYLEAQKGKTYETVEKDGVEVSHNEDLNRVQVRFPGKPSEEVRSRLKSNGFRWSPREVA
ncbi:DUF3560 domain-containing protein, partial [candidate division TA06 bacterium]|nr:DUF3560 domain-containing protein [candidate division TA06 bacterium]